MLSTLPQRKIKGLNFSYNKLHPFLDECQFLLHLETREWNQEHISSSGFQNQNRPNDTSTIPQRMQLQSLWLLKTNL